MIIFQSSSNQYTENEKIALDKYKYEKEEKIRIFIDELEKNSTDEFQQRRILKLKNDFNDILDEDDDSHNIKESEGEWNIQFIFGYDINLIYVVFFWYFIYFILYILFLF